MKSVLAVLLVVGFGLEHAVIVSATFAFYANLCSVPCCCTYFEADQLGW